MFPRTCNTEERADTREGSTAAPGYGLPAGGRPVLVGAPPPHRVSGRLARSARQKSRGGVTGGIGLGSAVVGSRDLVRIVARSRETGTLGSTLEFEPLISW